jgi:hypothetical protein
MVCRGVSLTHKAVWLLVGCPDGEFALLGEVLEAL